MHIQFTPAERAFQQDVREFIQQHYTPELAALVNNPNTWGEGIVRWQKILAERGWAAPMWPKEWGGTGWSVKEKYIFDTEYNLCGAAELVGFGLLMVSPIILAFGTEAQKQRFLPPIYNSDEWWCQGYSEPDAGSDLASLKTRAERVGDEYIVNGAKVWTTYAQYADWMFCLVRNESQARKQDGITFLLIDMKSEGISVNPIHTIDQVHSLNEVVFENVRVPVANRIGDEGRGWSYAKALLQHERTGIARVAQSRYHLTELKKLARSETRDGAPLIDNPRIRQRFSDIEVQLMALEFTEMRVLADLTAGNAPGPESSLLKVTGTEIQQAIHQLSMDIAGYYSAAVAPDTDIGHSFGDTARRSYMYGRAATIYGGTNEIQKNITAKAVLGL